VATFTNNTVIEGAAAGTVVGTLIIPPDAYGRPVSIAWSFQGAARDCFDLVKLANGRYNVVVKAGAVLDYETLSSYELIVTEKPQDGSPSTKSVFTINVTDDPADNAPAPLPSAPELPPAEKVSVVTLSSVEITENATAGTVVGTLSVVGDHSPKEEFNYFLVGAGSEHFELVKVGYNAWNVVVKQGAVLDFENADLNTFSISVRAVGNNFTDVTSTIEIKVTDDEADNVPPNQAPTDILLWNSTVSENAPGAVIGYLDGLDPDLGDSLSYAVKDNPLFRIVDGNLALAEGVSLDYEAGSSHQVTVVVTDGDGLSFEKVLTVYVGNVNEGPTDIALSNATIAENTSGVIGDLTALDPDFGDSISFSVKGDDAATFRIVDGKLGLVPGASFDFEAGATRQVTVVATDAAGLSFEKVLTINVSDVNERPTDLWLSGGTILENAVAGTEVGVLSVSDQDNDEAFSFALKNGDGRFRIEGNKIVVAEGATIDFEATPEIPIAVVVSDKGGLTYEKVVTVSVADVNEYNVIAGKAKKDHLYGTDKADAFVFDALPKVKGHFDHVRDFEVGKDKIQLGFGIGAENVRYDQKSGMVYVDLDGAGKGAEVAIVKMDPGLKLGLSDFLFV